MLASQGLKLKEATEFLTSGLMGRRALVKDLNLIHEPALISSLLDRQQKTTNVVAANTSSSKALQTDSISTVAAVKVTPGSVACRLARVLGQYKGSVQVILDLLLLLSAGEEQTEMNQPEAKRRCSIGSSELLPILPAVPMSRPVSECNDEEMSHCKEGAAELQLERPNQGMPMELLQHKPSASFVNKALVGKYTDLVLLLVRAMYDGDVPALVSTLCVLLTPESNCHLDTRLKVLSGKGGFCAAARIIASRLTAQHALKTFLSMFIHKFLLAS
jgi:hypothetical protein